MQILIALAVIFALWWFLAHGRTGQAGWDVLRRYRYAHRGLHRPGVPENSLAAFRAAAEGGFGAELDVHLTKDGRLAVIHDSSLRRVCGQEGIVEDLTAAELGRFRLEGTEEKIPFLEEVLPLFEGRGPLIVEIKPANGNWDALTAETVKCLDRFSVDYCMESFDPRSLLWLKGHRPEILRGQLTQNFLKDPAGLGLENRILLTMLFYNLRTRPDFIACKFQDRGTASVRLCCRWWGVQAVYWTIRSRRDLKQTERERALAIFEGFDPERAAS